MPTILYLTTHQPAKRARVLDLASSHNGLAHAYVAVANSLSVLLPDWQTCWHAPYFSESFFRQPEKLKFSYETTQPLEKLMFSL